MARISFEPDAVSGATFAAARRGYDTDEVRAYLKALAAELARLQGECDALRGELQARARDVAPLDVATVATALGDEAARVLTTARDAAIEIRARAEEAAGTLVDDANRDANRMREEADVEAARLREEARADADAEVEAARNQGREMVAEARAVRERMMADVARRKELARAQLEQVRLGHERVMGTFELAADALAAVTNDLRGLAPDVRRNASVDTGPVPVIDEPHVTPRLPVASSPVSVSVPAPTPAESVAEADHVDETDDDVALDHVDDDEPAPSEAGEPPAVLVSSFALGEEPTQEHQIVATEPPAPAPDGGAGGDEADAAPQHRRSADDVFARIRAARAAVTSELAGEMPTEAAHTTVLVAVDPGAVIAERNEALAPIEAAVARRLKRTLADEQNEVLDRLRRKNPRLTVDGLVGTLDDHAGAYERVVREEARPAMVAGARSLRAELDADGALSLVAREVVESLVAETRRELVGPLRDRLAQLVAAGDASTIADGVRTSYREWKTNRLDDLARHLVITAHGRAAFAALAPGTPVCWAVDPDHPCADGDDNTLGGPTPAGEAFPTGHRSTPAYVGCRCALAPAAT